MTHMRIAGALLSTLLLTACCSEKEPDPEPQPVAHKDPHEGVDEEFKKDPAMRGESAEEQVAIGNDKHPNKRVIWLNSFGRPKAELVIEELKKNPNFSPDDFMDDMKTASRIMVECMYMGENLRQEVSNSLKALGIKHRFLESKGELAKHLEVEQILINDE